MTKVIHISCPEYNFEDLNLEKVANCIDKALNDNFSNQDVVLRAIQSEKHDLSKSELIEKILDLGSDRFNVNDRNEVKVNDRPIDFYGMRCKIEGSITLPNLEGFHKWKPKCLERPQRRADIWMIYDPKQLENVEYMHAMYHVPCRDGYLFKDIDKKPDALLGLLVID